MLLTITTTHQPATDIGYLLHKNPAKLHSVTLNFGAAHLFYPEAQAERCTAALLLDVDPVQLVRKGGKPGEGFALEQYVNDRPYVASSFMSVALNKVFGTAFSGNCKQRPELVATALPLSVTIHALPCRGGEELLQRLFTPLGYAIAAERIPLDEHYPEWGESSYYTVTLTRTCPLREFLVHLYVLIPVLDNGKHYYVGQDELEKLLKFGADWLVQHPERELIARRYLKHSRSLVAQALERLTEDEEPDEGEEAGSAPKQLEDRLEEKISLNQQRLDWVVAQLKAQGAKRVLDLGCGEGKLLRALLEERSFTTITGADVSYRALEIARRRLKLDRMSETQSKRLNLLQTALTYRDRRLEGYDAATLVEVIEHLDMPRLDAFKRSVFEFTRPSLVLITTPNVEYNVLFEGMKPGSLRHKDHRFEWTRQQFQDWANAAAAQYGYTVTFDGIGDQHPEHGCPTQAGIFVRQE